MDLHTLTFYSLSAGLCLLLSLLLLVYAHLQSGTVMVRSTANMLLVMGFAFFIAGNTLVLPAWLMMIAANSLLLLGSVMFSGGVRAYLDNTPPKVDWTGVAWVVAAGVPFIWWGLFEPNGVMRAIVFSLVSALLNARVAWSLVQLTRQKRGGMAAKILAVLFGIATLWMLGRAGVLSFAAPVPIESRGANPTTWVTVFWFNVLAAAVTATILTMDHTRSREQLAERSYTEELGPQKSRSNLRLLWTLVSIIALTILAEVAIGYTVLYQREFIQQSLQLSHTLVMPLSTADVHRNTWSSIQPIAMGALLALGVVFLLALILTGVIRRRDDQDNFIHMLGHELKTPLSVIQMAASTMQLPDGSLGRIQRAVREMQNMIERCLQADRIESGLILPKLSQTDAVAVLAKLCSPPDVNERIALEMPPSVVCQTDPQLLSVVLGNLLDNALKYSPKDSMVLVRLAPNEEKGKAGLCYSVTNTPSHTGFPDPEQVFKKYYRAPQAHGETGSGLGLYIAEHLARMLQGQLRYVPSTTAVCFQLWIPEDPRP